MISRRWSWVGACSTGTSHLRAGTGCDDAGACLEISTPRGPALVSVVSDGAGSARLSSLGSRIVTRIFCTCAVGFLKRGGGATDITEDIASEWLDDVRDRLIEIARRHGETPKAFAATLVGCVVQPDAAAVIHIGDGACVIRLAGQRNWEVPSWPAQGEYAATTFFVTDDPQPRTVVSHLIGEVEEVAVFSDGLERLALDFHAMTAYEPFFESMFPALRGAQPGRQRRLSIDLRTFLASPAVTDRTDDDKTLVMARRT